MVEVEVICRTALYAPATVALPDFEFDGGRDEARVRECSNSTQDPFFDRLEVELEDLASAVGSDFRIYDLKKALVGPECPG